MDFGKSEKDEQKKAEEDEIHQVRTLGENTTNFLTKGNDEINRRYNIDLG
jgi:hypothetical protein